MSLVAWTEHGELRKVTVDGEPAYHFACQGCGTLGLLDDDQFNGRVSVLCPESCGYHETRDFAAAVERAGGWTTR